MKILLVGYGFVGKAVFNTLKSKYNVVIIDPQYNNTNIADHLDAAGIVVCVPTPSLPNGGCDSQHIANVLDQCPKNTPILIKSTVTPTVVNAIETIYPDLAITYSPEFLREDWAIQDFAAQSFIVLGGSDPNAFWQTILTDVLPECKICFNCSQQEASIIKYTINSFLATKVAFFNNLYDLCQSAGVEYNIIKQIVTHDTRIGSSHTSVPGNNGERGFGGNCFPKDTTAFIHYANSINVSLDVLKSAVASNKTVRKVLDK